MRGNADMPIYEFKCLACNEVFEVLTTKQDDCVEMECPKCHSENFERVLSCSYHQMGGSSSAGPSTLKTERSCSSGSCTTYEIPGPT